MEGLADQAADHATESALDLNTENAADTQTADSGSDSVLELETVDKFKWGGSEYTPDDLQNAFFRQSDYTKKTMELAEQRKNLESQQKFFDNFFIDAETVRQNPDLAAKFKQTYPESFHDKLDMYLKQAGTGSDTPKPDKDLLEKLSKMEEKYSKLEGSFDQLTTEAHEREVAASEKYLDSLFDTLGKKYEYADEDAIIQKAMHLLEENKKHGTNYKMTDAAWDRLFKQDHDARQKKYTELYQKQMNAQIEKSHKASDVGVGGTAPGQKPASVALKDVADMAIADLQARNG